MEVDSLRSRAEHMSPGADVLKGHLVRTAGANSNIIGLSGEFLYVKDVDYDKSGILSAACDLDCVIAESRDVPQAVKDDFSCYSLGTERDLQLEKKLPHESCKLPPNCALSLQSVFIAALASAAAKEPIVKPPCHNPGVRLPLQVARLEWKSMFVGLEGKAVWHFALFFNLHLDMSS